MLLAELRAERFGPATARHLRLLNLHKRSNGSPIDLSVWRELKSTHGKNSTPSNDPRVGDFPLELSPDEQLSRTAALQGLLVSWLADESGYDEQTWPIVKHGLDEYRLSSRKFFDE